MAATLLGSLLVSLGLENGEFKSGLSDAEKQFKASARRIEKVGQGMTDLGQKMSLAVTAPLVALGVASIKAATESKDAIAQVESALSSMGKQAGLTSEQLQGLATGIMRKSLYDDDEILRSVTANLLTFGNVAGDVFVRAQQAAADLSARLGQDLQSSAIQVGKALNDPIKGVTALQRVGVSFTAAQKDQIKTLVETGRAAEAQRLILAELEKQFGGAAEAARNANPFGAMKQSFAEFQEQIGAKLLVMLPAITDAITSVLDAFNSLSPGMQRAAVIGGILAAAFGPVLVVMGSLVSVCAPLIAGLRGVAAIALSTGTAAGAATAGFAGLRAMMATLIGTLGLVGIALAALGAGLYYVWNQTNGTREATAAYAKAQAESEKVTEGAATAATTLATAHGKAREQALAAARAEAENIKQKLASARASVLLAQAELFRARAKTEELRQSDNAAVQFGGADPSFAGLGSSLTVGQGGERKAEANLRSSLKTVENLEAGLKAITGAINSAAAPAVANIGAGTSSDSKGGKGSKGSSGRSPDDIRAQFNGELLQYAQRIAAADSDKATTAEQAAEYDRQAVEYARRETLNQLKNDQDYSAAQKEQLRGVIDELEQAELDRIERDKSRRLDQEAQQLADAKFDIERDGLQLQYDLADTQADRKRIALSILDAERAHLKASLEAVIASQTIADADRQRAQLALDALNASGAAERESVSRRNETNAERYRREINKTPAQMNEAFDDIKIDGLEALNDGLVDAIVNFKSLGDVASSVIRQIIGDLLRLQIQKAIIAPLAGMLGLGGGAISGAVGGLSKQALKLNAFAGGTSFAPGGLALVGERGPELVDLPRGSRVIPNHELRGSSGTNVSQTFNIMTPDADSFRRSERQIKTAARRRMAA